MNSLLRHWNWKSALLSSLCRGAIFFFANLTAGLSAAEGAMIAEFSYRTVTAGFYGAVTQTFCDREPRWMTALAASIGIPCLSQLLEFTVHWLRGTPNLRASMIASASFTVITTLFNLHAMRQGVLVVGQNSQPLSKDLRELPKTIGSFLSSGCGVLPDR